MSAADLFDLDRLPEKERLRYGPDAFGQHTLMARNLIENGSTFVMVANGMPWDCHVLNHEIYQMLVPELDNVFYQLVTDLEDRGMLEDTLVMAMGEFGRTPWLNAIVDATITPKPEHDHGRRWDQGGRRAWCN